MMDDTPQRTADERWYAPHLFEILIVIQLVVFQAWAATLDFAPGPRDILASFLGVARLLIALIAVGVAVRAIFGAMTGRLRDRLAVWKSRDWLITTARLVVFGAILSYEYTWMKLLIPVLHGRNFDGLFWRIDGYLLFGHSPNILFLNLFGPSGAASFLDRWYGVLFVQVLLVSIAFFLSSTNRVERVSFANGLTVLWLVGVWMYVATPSVGPCYAYPQVFAEWWDSMPHSVVTQRLLYENYGRVLRVAQGESLLVNPVYGVAAFPSLHVGLVTLVAIQVRRDYRRFQLPAWIIVAFMILGSVVTGWHYLIDSVGGVALAVLATLAAAGARRIDMLAESRKDADDSTDSDESPADESTAAPL